jgi:hypothetical protein
MTRYFVLAASLAIGIAPLGASSRLAVRVSPAVAFAPADLRVQATIETDRDNRVLQVIAESDDFYRSSEIQLDGDHAPRTNLVAFRSLPGGEYNIRVVVYGSTGEPVASSSSFVNVVERGR